MIEPGSQIELVADRARADLLRTLRELDQRKQRALDVRGQLRRHTKVALAAGIGAVGLLGAAVGTSLNRRSHRPSWRQLRRRQLGRAAKRAWRHPERLAVTPPEEGVARLFARRLAITLGTTLGGALIRHAFATR